MQVFVHTHTYGVLRFCSFVCVCVCVCGWANKEIYSTYANSHRRSCPHTDTWQLNAILHEILKNIFSSLFGLPIVCYISGGPRK